MGTFLTKKEKMLCEISSFGNFLFTYLFISILSTVITGLLSLTAFMYWYVYPTYEKWIYKSNPRYTPADKVKDEIIQTGKGIMSAAFCPAFALWMANNQYGYAYCGVEPYGYSWLFVQAFIIILGSDFFEFYYHRLGHTTDFGWVQHKHHHVFFNPSPFSVIADEYTDQFIRALPLVIFPCIMPTNVDVLYFIFGVFFYFYGVYLHSGHELSFLSAHNYWVNTPFQHYLHHAKSVYMKPYHTGFFIKVWDRMFGSMYDKKCVCAECARKEGKRTFEAWEKIEKPDYSVLLDYRFWRYGDDFNKNIANESK